MVILAQSSKEGSLDLERSWKISCLKTNQKVPRNNVRKLWHIENSVERCHQWFCGRLSTKMPSLSQFHCKDQGGNVVAALLWPNWRFCLSVSILAGKKFYSTPRHPYHLSYTWNNLKTIKHFKFSDALKGQPLPTTPPRQYTHTRPCRSVNTYLSVE